MSPTVVCQLCGTRYAEADGRSCGAGCPMGSACGLLKCPGCGYEVPAPTRLTRWLARWLGRGERRA